MISFTRKSFYFRKRKQNCTAETFLRPRRNSINLMFILTLTGRIKSEWLIIKSFWRLSSTFWKSLFHNIKTTVFTTKREYKYFIKCYNNLWFVCEIKSVRTYLQQENRNLYPSLCIQEKLKTALQIQVTLFDSL